MTIESNDQFAICLSTAILFPTLNGMIDDVIKFWVCLNRHYRGISNSIENAQRTVIGPSWIFNNQLSDIIPFKNVVHISFVVNYHE